MEPITAVLTLISVANIVVLGFIIRIFARVYLYSKAQLPLAMITFSGLLLLHNIIGAEAYFVSEQIFSEAIFPYMVGIYGTELVGLLVFLKFSSQ